MEKIDILKTLDEGRKDAYIGTACDVAKEGFSLGYEACQKFNELIDHLNLLDKLAIRVARLEVYYKAHRKEHSKDERKKI